MASTDLTGKQMAGRAGLGGGLGSGIAGGIAYLTSDDVEQAKKLRDQYLAGVEGLDPNQLAAINAQAGDTAFNNITESPEGREAQLRALQRLQAISTENDPETTAAYAKAAQEAAQVERGVRMAALQRLAQRGAGRTSGLALAAQQDAAQAATQAASQRDLDTAAEARRRALQALMGSAQLGGQLRGQDYQKQADRAAAQDGINRFNAGQRLTQGQAVYGARQGKVGMLGNASQMYQQAGNQDVAAASAFGGGIGSIVDAGLMAFGGA